MSLRQRVLDAGDVMGYPLSRDGLLAALEGDQEAFLVVTTMADHHFVVPEELSERLEDALGMPDADSTGTALDIDTDWRAGG